ncbi:hypothetical protein DLM76_20475 [Leptospira yasudae]|uniref:hypothetical protein n=1 Tax=Leptospira yasudae TaxID=2202201 RepID=UPI000E59CB7F|nr:hypothetical protein [Leptospira yasudae]RHX90242.1 hypothetical protein DLM76_20475 [Leptospira yasudae]
MEPIKLQLILNGAWNPKIFTPPWVQQFLFESQDSFDVLFSVKDIEFGYSLNNISIYPSASTIKIVCNDIKKDTLVNAKIIADKILGNLQHTPVSSAVIELTFSIDSEKSEKNAIEILNKMNVAGYQLSAFKFIKTEPGILNKEMLVSLVNNKLQVQFLNRFNRETFIKVSVKETINKNIEEVNRWASK